MNITFIKFCSNLLSIIFFLALIGSCFPVSESLLSLLFGIQFTAIGLLFLLTFTIRPPK